MDVKKARWRRINSRFLLKLAWTLWVPTLFMAPAGAGAQEHGFGLGVILGEPTGISGKKWLSTTTALDFAAAWSFRKEDSLTLYADILSHNFRMIPVKSGRLPFYYGIGARMKFDDKDPRLGVRIPFGLNYHFADVSLDLFFEIVPILELLPETEFELNAAIGIRYFFQ